MKRLITIMLLVLTLCLAVGVVYAADTLTYNGEKYTGMNIGETGTGKATVDGSKLLISGCGADIWGSVDDFYYVFKEISGDFTATLKVTKVSDADPWAKLGIMARATTEAGSVHAIMAATNQNNIAFQFRPEADGESFHFAAADFTYENGNVIYLKMVRKGDQITAFYSEDNKTWIQVETTDPVVLPTGKILVGVAHTSHNAGDNGQDGECFDFVVK